MSEVPLIQSESPGTQKRRFRPAALAGLAVLAIAAAVALAAPPFPSQSEVQGSPADQAIEVVQAWIKALNSGDVDTYIELRSDGYVDYLTGGFEDGTYQRTFYRRPPPKSFETSLRSEALFYYLTGTDWVGECGRPAVFPDKAVLVCRLTVNTGVMQAYGAEVRPDDFLVTVQEGQITVQDGGYDPASSHPIPDGNKRALEELMAWMSATFPDGDGPCDQGGLWPGGLNQPACGQFIANHLDEWKVYLETKRSP